MLGAVSSVAAAELVNRIVASIDGEPITLYELETYERKHLAALLAAGASPSRKDLLDALITDKLVEKEIAAKGIRVDEEDVDHYVARVREQNRLSEEQLREALAQQGLTWEKYREQVRAEIQKIQLLNREIRGKVNVTPQDVERYYEAHKSDYARPARVHLRHIVLRLARDAPPEVEQAVRERLEAIRKRVVEGREDFAAVAKEVSEDAAAQSGGDLGEVEPGKILPQFQEAVARLREGEVSSPIRTDAGLHLLRVEKRIAESFVPLREVSDEIREKLYSKALDERYRRWLVEDLKKRHYVEIRL
jgi:peptidyl-prolyl cis-trans isomerase SurA